MPTHINFHYKEIEDLWPHIEKYQMLATHSGIADIFQDAGGKTLQLLIAMGLDSMPGRNGADAKDRMGNLYELKTTDVAKKTSGFSTNHHLDKDTIRSYRERRWIFGYYEGITLRQAYLVEAKDLEPTFKKWERSLVGKSHLNNPKIPLDLPHKLGTPTYLKDVPPDWAIKMVREYDALHGVIA